MTASASRFRAIENRRPGATPTPAADVIKGLDRAPPLDAQARARIASATRRLKPPNLQIGRRGVGAPRSIAAFLKERPEKGAVPPDDSKYPMTEKTVRSMSSCALACERAGPRAPKTARPGNAADFTDERAACPSPECRPRSRADRPGRRRRRNRLVRAHRADPLPICSVIDKATSSADLSHLGVELGCLAARRFQQNGPIPGPAVAFSIGISRTGIELWSPDFTSRSSS